MGLISWWHRWIEPDSCRKRARKAQQDLHRQGFEAEAVVVDVGPGPKHAIVEVGMTGGSVYYDPSGLRKGIDGPWYRNLPSDWAVLEALWHFE